MNRDFRKAYIIAGGILLLLGGWIIFTSFSWRYYTSLGPGPGFLPFWIGLLLSGLGVLMFVINIIALRQCGAKEQGAYSEHLFTVSRLKNVGLTAGPLAGCIILLKWLGFILAISLLSLFLLQIVGKWGWIKSIILSVIVSVGFFWICKSLLYLPLPVGLLGF
jgi:putative tricarboxylic transport membrane protein